VPSPVKDPEGNTVEEKLQNNLPGTPQEKKKPE
jgi:hypothetical protein